MTPRRKDTPLPPNVRRLPSGSLRVIVNAGGRRHHVTLPAGSTRSEIEQARAQLTIRAGAIRVGQIPTVRLLLEERIASFTGTARVLTDYRSMIPRIPHEFLSLPIDKVGPPTVRALYRQLADAGMSVHRIARVADLVGTAFDTAAGDGIISSNPTRYAPRPSITAGGARVEIVPPTADQVNTILAALPAGWFAVTVELAVVTGARRGELMGLRWHALDLPGQTISIHRSVSDTEAGTIVKDIKTGSRGRRNLKVDAETVATLRRWRAVQDERALRRGRPLSPWVFGDPGDGDLDPPRADRVTQAWTKARPSHEVLGVRFQDLRHYHATVLISAGVPISLVSKRLGHSSTKITEDIYGHLTPAVDQVSADIIAGSIKRRRAG